MTGFGVGTSVSSTNELWEEKPTQKAIELGNLQTKKSSNIVPGL